MTFIANPPSIITNDAVTIIPIATPAPAANEPLPTRVTKNANPTPSRKPSNVPQNSSKSLMLIKCIAIAPIVIMNAAPDTISIA